MTAWDSVTCGGYLLTVKQGPNAGRTHYECLCGWAKYWPTRAGARRMVNVHLKSNGYPPLLPRIHPLPGHTVPSMRRNSRPTHNAHRMAQRTGKKPA